MSDALSTYLILSIFFFVVYYEILALYIVDYLGRYAWFVCCLF